MPGRAALLGAEPGRSPLRRRAAGETRSAPTWPCSCMTARRAGLATQAALVAACGRGAQLGIFVKGYQALESSRRLDTVVLDKTGTVTTGQMTLTHVPHRRQPDPRRAAALRGRGGNRLRSTRWPPPSPLPPAVTPADGGPLPWPGDSGPCPGLGADAMVEGRGGDRRPGPPADRTRPGHPRRPDRGLPHLGGRRLHRGPGRLGRRGPRRPGRDRHRETVGRPGRGRPARARAPARSCSPGTTRPRPARWPPRSAWDEVIAGTLPGDKAAVIGGLRARGHAVAMVGDGVNDAARAAPRPPSGWPSAPAPTWP